MRAELVCCLRALGRHATIYQLCLSPASFCPLLFGFCFTSAPCDRIREKPGEHLEGPALLRPTIIAHGKGKAAATTNEPLLPHCYLGHNQGVVVAYPPPTLSYAMTASFLPSSSSIHKFFYSYYYLFNSFFSTLSQLTIY